KVSCGRAPNGNGRPATASAPKFEDTYSDSACAAWGQRHPDQEETRGTWAWPDRRPSSPAAARAWGWPLPKPWQQREPVWPSWLVAELLSTRQRNSPRDQERPR